MRQRWTSAVALAAVGLVAGWVGVAFAAPIGLSSDRVGVAAAAVLPCDDDGFAYSFTTSGGVVVAVTVADIADPACESGVLRLTLTGQAGAVLASAGPEIVPQDGDTLPGTLTLTTDAQPLASSVTGVHVSLEGP